jgi:hypothetical protein
MDILLSCFKNDVVCGTAGRLKDLRAKLASGKGTSSVVRVDAYYEPEPPPKPLSVAEVS